MQMIYIYLNTFSLLIILILALLSYKNRDEKHSKVFLYIMIFVGIWTLATMLELIVDSFYLKVLFRNIIQFAMVCVSILNYWFVILYIEAKRVIYKHILRIFILLNTLAMILLFTDPIHHLLRSEVYLVYEQGSSTLMVSSTLLGMFFVIIRFVLMGFATMLLFGHLFKTFKNMRKQVSMIFIGFLLALLLLLLRQYWLEELGITVSMSIILTIPYLFIGIGFLKYDFLSVSPLAKEWVFDTLSEGIIVLSNTGKILESNISARRFMEECESLLDEDSLEEIHKSKKNTQYQIKIERPLSDMFFDVEVHHILAKNSKKKGSVVVIKEVTNQVNIQAELIQKANYDGLTQIYNKNALEKSYDLIKESPVSIMVIDINKFKIINDTYGHPVGDIVIVGIVDAMKKSIRKKDIIGRIGGDEFCIILTECSTELCHVISNRILENVYRQKYDVSCNLPLVEISIGAFTNITIGSKTFLDIYKQADLALYEAKEKGDNCAVIY